MVRQRHILATMAAALSWASAASGEIMPQPGKGDPHIQTVAYDPQEVVGLHVAGGYALTVMFAPDERIQTVTVGDGNAWQVQVNRAADNLVIKPQGSPASTNLTVITDARTYNFTLYGSYALDGAQPYLVSFTYPSPLADEAKIAPPEAGLYRMRGNKSLYPLEMSDDGTLTYIRWPADVVLPAVYQEDASGAMALVNGGMKNGDFAVQGVYARLVFVSGKKRAIAYRLKSRKEP